MNIIDQIFKLLGDILAGLIQLLGEVIGLTGRSFTKQDGKLTASFAPMGVLLSRWNHGFCLTGVRSLTRKDSFRHTVVFSPSGGGKSTVVVVPTILRLSEHPCSMVIHDPSGELFTLTSGTLASRGFAIRRISFARPTGSDRFNPMYRAKRPADIRKVSSMIIRQAMGGGKADPFWDQSAAALITVLMQVLQAQEPVYRNLANVRHVLNALGRDPEKLDDLVARCATDELFAEYSSLMAYDKKVLSGIIASARAALDLWTDDDIALLTSEDTLDLENLRTKPTVLYVQSHTAQLDYHSLLVSLLFEQLLGVLMQELPKPHDLDVFLIMDEASSLRVPVLPIAMANLRKYRCGILLTYQDYSQLVHLYGRYEAETVRQNALKVYFSDQSLEQSMDLERLLGKYEVKDEEGRHRVRPLLTSDEIRVLPKDRAIIIAGGHRPILARLKPFFKQYRMRRLTLVPPVDLDHEERPPLSKLSLEVTEEVSTNTEHVEAANE